MMKILILLTCLFLSTIGKAEYSGYHIKFEIQTTTGKTIEGFVYISGFINIDSIKSTNYLKIALDQIWNERIDRDSFNYYKERIKYEYKSVGDSLGEKTPIYALNNKQSISAKEILSIRITEMIDYTYLIGISSPLSISDTNWTNKDPLISYAFGGYLCHHQIFIHKNSKKIDKVIKQLLDFQNALKTIEIHDDKGDEIDKQIFEIIQNLHGKKVVIVSECTC